MSQQIDIADKATLNKVYDFNNLGRTIGIVLRDHADYTGINPPGTDMNNNPIYFHKGACSTLRTKLYLKFSYSPVMDTDFMKLSVYVPTPLGVGFCNQVNTAEDYFLATVYNERCGFMYDILPSTKFIDLCSKGLASPGIDVPFMNNFAVMFLSDCEFSTNKQHHYIELYWETEFRYSDLLESQNNQ